MEIALKIGSLLSLLAIGIQDFKERNVFLFLFFIAGASMSILYYKNVYASQYLGNILLNLTLILIVIAVLFVYSALKLKQSLFKIFGIGDLLFFIVLACSFSTASFIVLFVGSLVFSLVIFTFIKKKLNWKTVPLAGLQASFLGLVLIINWLFNLVNLYQ